MWSLHPSHLDRQGLVACWREALLAQAVLRGKTKGYRSHPQLERFRQTCDPLGAVGAYLHGVADEADRRGYRFDRSRIRTGPAAAEQIPVTTGQLAFEWEHLGAKLNARSPDDAARWENGSYSAHPLFRVVEGGVEPWERPGPRSDPPGSP